MALRGFTAFYILIYWKERNMEPGAFSMSLVVKDIRASTEFYEKLGFRAFMGDHSQNWLIMKIKHMSWASFKVRLIGPPLLFSS
jgi:hypothetical protein